MAPLTGVLSDRFLWVWVLVQVHVSECVYERERECCVLLRENWKTSEKAGVWVCVKERETQREMCFTQAKNSEKNRPFSRHYKVMQCRIFTTLCVFVRTCKQTRIHAGICCAHTDLWL